MQADYTIHAHHQHLSWDNARPPAVTVTPGETVEFRDIDALCGQITPQSTAADLANLDFARIDPLAGPVYVDGADVGDALVVTPVGMDTAGWGWTAIIPGYGVLAEDFPAPSLHHWSYAPDLSAPAMFSGIAQVPLRPFCATMGTAPATDGALATIPTYSWGGSMALRDVTVGVDLSRILHCFRHLRSCPLSWDSPCWNRSTRESVPKSFRIGKPLAADGRRWPRAR